MHYPRLASRVFSTPLLIEQGKLQTILQVLAPRFMQGRAAFSGEPNNAVPARDFTIQDGVGIVPVSGTLVSRSSDVDAVSGLLSYDTLIQRFDAALKHPDVKSVLLDIDSPGGEAAGCFDAADHIFNARGSKPITAFCNPLAASAAYAIASAADEVVVSRLSYAGSIGVITAHIDQSGYDEKEGLKYTLVYAGEHKADLNPHRPISDSALADLQARVNEVYSLFVGTVARNRNMKADAVEATQAGIFMGQAAVQAGLADRVSTFSETFSRLRAGQKAIFSMSNQPKENPMSETNQNDAGQNNTDNNTPAAPENGTKPNPAPAPEASPAPAKEESAKDAATAAAKNAANIIGMAISLGVDMTFAQNLVSMNTSFDDAKGKMADHLAANQPAPVVRSAASNQGSAVDPSLPLEDRCKAEWDKNPQLRAEFGKLSTYVAYEKANSDGLVKVLSNK